MLTVVEIDAKAIAHNLKEIRAAIGPDVLLMPVVKANAYGHGMVQVAKICDKNREADRLCVANLDEALALIKSKITKPLLILSYFDFDADKIVKAVNRGVGFPIYEINQARFLNKIGERVQKKIKAHVKVDTGASRVGILPSQTTDFVRQLQKFSHLEIEGLWSHFASSEEDELHTERQYLAFREVIYQLQKEGIEIPLRHMACSAALVTLPKSHFNAVRAGLSVYGLHPCEKTKDKLSLQAALSWRTKIIQIKTLPGGTKVGYGGTYTTEKITTLAVIPVGYWDGYDRRLSNAASVLVKGKICPIRGRICMNLSMVDITEADNVKVGDAVTLIGNDRDKSITADELAQWASTINYEIVDRINPLLPRVVV